MSEQPTIYRGNGWEIRCGRWQDSPPDVVDVVISDPPFTDHVSQNQRRSTARGTRDRWLPTGQAIDNTSLPFDGVDPFEVGPAIVGLSRRWVVLFCAIEQAGTYRDACGDAYLRGGWWDKTNATPQFSGDRPAMPGESIVVLHRAGRKRWNGGGRPLRHVGPSAHAGNGSRLHETQKPLWLMLDLVADFSDPDELVWDPYCGSGTTGVACLRLGRRFLGHEMQPHYAEIAAERIEAETRGLTLQDVRRGQTSILDRLHEPDPGWLERLARELDNG